MADDRWPRRLEDRRTPDPTECPLGVVRRMIRRHLMMLRLLLMVADAISATSVFVLVSLIRFGDNDVAGIWGLIGIDVRIAALLFGAAWVMALWYMGLYRMRVRWRMFSEARDVTKATVLVLVATLSTLFVFKQEDVSRLFLGLLFVSQPLVTLAGRTLLRYGFGSIRRRGYNTGYMVIAGTGALAQDFADRVEARPSLGIKVIGHICVPGETGAAVSRPVVGTLDDIEAVFHSRVVDEVAVCLEPDAAGYVEPITRLAADEGKTVRIPLDQIAERQASLKHEEFDGFLVRSVVSDHQHEVGLIAKRLIDITGAIVGLVALSPLLIGTAIVIRLRQGSTVLFRQRRVGLHGRPFTIYKFRTMVPDAEARLGDVAHLNVRRGHAFKALDDPRVTGIGAFLRRSSLDELPQLLNVLRGEMSLVGPRPPLPHEVEGYDVWHRRRLSMKPGITGLWQVEAREEPEFDRWVECDLSYIDRWSLGLDLRILARTIPVVLAGGGR
jgi:exopolysaccharide biosynthesis polyprenyl glycosylphosphotransferase